MNKWPRRQCKLLMDKNDCPCSYALAPKQSTSDNVNCLLIPRQYLTDLLLFITSTHGHRGESSHNFVAVKSSAERSSAPARDKSGAQKSVTTLLHFLYDDVSSAIRSDCIFMCQMGEKKDGAMPGTSSGWKNAKLPQPQCRWLLSAGVRHLLVSRSAPGSMLSIRWM